VTLKTTRTNLFRHPNLHEYVKLQSKEFSCLYSLKTFRPFDFSRLYFIVLYDVRIAHTYTHIRTNVCIYIQTYLHTYIHTHIHTYVHTYIHTYKHTYVRTYVHYRHIYVHVYERTHILHIMDPKSSQRDKV